MRLCTPNLGSWYCGVFLFGSAGLDGSGTWDELVKLVATASSISAQDAEVHHRHNKGQDADYCGDDVECQSEDCF